MDANADVITRESLVPYRTKTAEAMRALRIGIDPRQEHTQDSFGTKMEWGENVQQNLEDGTTRIKYKPHLETIQKRLRLRGDEPFYVALDQAVQAETGMIQQFNAQKKQQGKIQETIPPPPDIPTIELEAGKGEPPPVAVPGQASTTKTPTGQESTQLPNGDNYDDEDPLAGLYRRLAANLPPPTTPPASVAPNKPSKWVYISVALIGVGLLLTLCGVLLLNSYRQQQTQAQIANLAATSQVQATLQVVEKTATVEAPQLATVIVEVEKEVTKVVTIPVTVVVKETVEKLITVPVPQTATVVVAPSPIPTLPPPAIPLPFEDNFDAGLAGVWEQTSGNWTMVDGHLTTTGPQPPQSIIMTGDTSWTDYAIEYDLRANWRDRGVNRVILRDSGGEQMAFEFSDGRNSARLLYVKDRQAKVIAEGSVGFLDIQPPFSVRVEAKGDIYRMFTSGVLHMTVQDDTLTHGRVGFYEAGTGAWFDNFKVSPLP